MRYNFVGGRVEQILGVPMKELMAEAAQRWRHVHPDDAEVVRSILADATQRVRAGDFKDSVEIVVRIVERPTAVGRSSASCSAASRRHGDLERLLPDITERKQAEDEPKRRGRFRRLFEDSATLCYLSMIAVSSM